MGVLLPGLFFAVAEKMLGGVGQNNAQIQPTLATLSTSDTGKQVMVLQEGGAKPEFHLT